MTRINCYEEGINWTEKKFKDISNAIRDRFSTSIIAATSPVESDDGNYF